MKLRDWFRMKKEKRAARRRAKLERKLGIEHVEPTEPIENLDPIEELEPEEAAPADRAQEGEQPPSRFTEEYKEFLKKQAEIKEEEYVPLREER